MTVCLMKTNAFSLLLWKIACEKSNEENTHIFVSVGVLVLWLFLGRNLTVWAIMFTVVICSTMVCYNHQLLNITLQTKKHKSNVLDKIPICLKNRMINEWTVKQTNKQSVNKSHSLLAGMNSQNISIILPEYAWTGFTRQSQLATVHLTFLTWVDD